MRRARGHSLKAVAGATGISSSFLSLVETDRSDITFSRLHRLLEFYGATFSDLVPEEPADPLIVRAGERRSLPSPAEGLEMHLLSHDGERVLRPVLVEYRPGAQLDEYRGGPGETFLHVLEGELDVELEGHEPFALGPGDSVSYDSSRGLRITNPGTETARLIAVGISLPRSG
jgi:transcriptional regulator with XRE-family HTH domain